MLRGSVIGRLGMRLEPQGSRPTRIGSGLHWLQHSGSGGGRGNPRQRESESY